MTVRRDIESLAQRGLLERVHGGRWRGRICAISRRARRPRTSRGFVAKSQLMRQAKAAIAARRPRWSRRGVRSPSGGHDDGGGGPRTADRARITVVTNCCPRRNCFADSAGDGWPDRRADRRDAPLVGGARRSIADGALRGLHVDLLFLGVHGLDERAGLTTPNLVEAETNRALIDAAHRLRHRRLSKWGVVGPAPSSAWTASTSRHRHRPQPPCGRRRLGACRQDHPAEVPTLPHS